MEIDTPLLEQYTNQSISSIHHTLRASRRRLTIALTAHRALTSGEAEEPSATDAPMIGNRPVKLSVRELARQITSIEENVSIEMASGEPYRNVYTSLVQTHLPELDEVGVLHFDSDRKTIRPGPNLMAMATIAAISSPVAQLLFHNAVVDIYFGDEHPLQDSIAD